MPLKPKCLACNKACRSNQFIHKCSICKLSIHRKCAHLSHKDLQKMRIEKDPFYCPKCLAESIPFQSINNIDMESDIPVIDGLSLNPSLISDPSYLNDFFSTETPTTDSDNFVSINDSGDIIPCYANNYHKADCISFDVFDSDMSANNEFLTESNFSSLGINIRSLSNTKNFALLEVFLNSLCFRPTVIAINETHLRDNDPGPHCDLPGYDFVSNCRTVRKGGGVGIFVADSLNYAVRNDLTVMDEGIFESLFIEIKGVEKSILFGTIYRSPTENPELIKIFMNHLDKCLSIINKSKKSCFIQGDNNFNLMDIDNANCSNFSELMFDNSFFSHINKPTRITNSSATCIDHIWSNIYDIDIFSGIITDKIADHMITFQLSKLNIFQPNINLQKRSISRLDPNKFVSILNDKNVDDILYCNDPNLALSKFEEHVKEAQT